MIVFISDTFVLTFKPTAGAPVVVPFTTKGVLWEVDKDRKFKNPDGYNPQNPCASYAVSYFLALSSIVPCGEANLLKVFLYRTR